MGEAETAGTLQSGKEKAQGALLSVYKYLMGGNEEENSSQQIPLAKEEAQIKK